LISARRKFIATPHCRYGSEGRARVGATDRRFSVKNAEALEIWGKKKEYIVVETTREPRPRAKPPLVGRYRDRATVRAA